MLTAIKELGEEILKIENRNISNLLSILVQSTDPNKNPYVMVIVFKKDNAKYKYKEIILEQNDRSKIEKYLYRRGASQGPDITPTSKITEVEKTFNKKIKAWFKNIKSRTSDSLISAISNALEQSEKIILRDLSKKWESTKVNLNRNQSGVITIGIKENHNSNYIGDYQIFRDILVQTVKEKYQKISRQDHICSICGQKKQEVYGNAIGDIFKFYTLDKPGYIAGGFREEMAWRNSPCCLECVLKIEEGKKFLDEHLKTKMGGHQYYLIPKFIFGSNTTQAIIDTFFTSITQPQKILSSKTLARITEDEKEILELLGEFKDVLTYNFLFFETPNPQVFKINLLIEDILPSRISRIFQAKKQAEQSEIFKNENIEFRFDEFRRFIPSQKIFLEIVDKIFRGIPFEQEFLYCWIMTYIRRQFINNSYLKPLVLRVFVALIFLKKLEILTSKMFPRKGGDIMTELKENAEDFFNKFPDFFSTSAHKSVFLLGVLAQKLLNIQFRERNATPFRKNLIGLRMKEEDFKSLLPKIQNKLEEYGKNYYRSLETLISGYFLESGKNWNISTDELNFYFVLGMNLVDEVDKTLKLTEEKEV